MTVCESHNIPGGAAHAWVQKGYHFESGPSLYSGMAGTGAAANPLALVFKAIDEPLDLIEYNQWNVLLPEGEFLTQVMPLIGLILFHGCQFYVAITQTDLFILTLI